MPTTVNPSELFQKHKYHDYIMKYLASHNDTGFDINNPNTWKHYQDVAEFLQSDFDYLDSIEKYKGTDYYNTLLSNPHLRASSNGYTPSGLENLGNFMLNVGSFGLAGSSVFSDASRSRYYEDLQQKSNQFLNEKLDLMRQQDYNSESAQASRQRLAGLNPDLTGGVSGSSAPENDQPISTSEMPDSAPDILNIASIPFSLVNGIMSLYQSFQQSSALNLSNVAQEISNNNSAMNFVINTIAQGFIDSNDENTIPDLENIGILLDSASKRDYSGYSRSTRKLINKFFSGFKDDIKNGKMPVGIESRIAELRNIATTKNWESANIQSNPLYSEDFKNMVIGIYNKFGDLPNLVQELSLESSLAESSYNKDFYNSSDGDLAGRASNSANELAISTNEHQKSIVSTYKEIDKVFSSVEKDLKDFANSGKRGAVFGLLGLLLLPTLKAQVFQGIHVSMPSISRSVKVDSKGRTTTSSDFSW